MANAPKPASRYTSIAILAIGILVAIVAAILCLNAGTPKQMPVATPAPLASKVATPYISPTTAPRPPSSAETILLAQLQSADPAERVQAVQTLREITVSQRGGVVDEMNKWLKPLLAAELYEELLALTDESIPLKSSDSVLVADQQEARARALLALKRYEQALMEAKSAFNVAPQRNAARVADLLADTLKKARPDAGSSDAGKFKSEITSTHQPTEQSVLKSIHVTPRYAEVLSQADDGVDAFVGKGNIELINDHPVEARQWFVKAAGIPGLKGKKLFVPLEGIARTLRAENGFVAADDFIATMKLGAVRSPVLASIAPLNLDVNSLHDAGRAIPLVISPPSGKPGAPNPKLDVAGQLDHTLSFLQQANPGDPELLAWLRANDGKFPVQTKEQAELAALLKKSPLDLPVLFTLGHDLHLATDDARSATLIFAAAAEKMHALLVASSSPSEQLPFVKMIEQFRDACDAAMWDRMENKQDKEALGALYLLFTDFLKYCPDNDVALSLRRPPTTSSLARVLFKMGKKTEALEMIEKADMSQMNEGWQKLAGWRKALILYDLKRYEEALPLFRVVESWEGFRERAGAQRCIVVSLAYLGREEARAELQKYLDVYKPDQANKDIITAIVNTQLKQAKTGLAVTVKNNG